MIVPTPSPRNPQKTVWATKCNRCGKQRLASRVLRDWLISQDDEMDVHFCPRCVRRIARELLDGGRRARWARWWRQFIAALARRGVGEE